MGDFIVSALWNSSEIPGGQRSADVSVLKGGGVDEHGCAGRVAGAQDTLGV